ncbi:ABC transporter ATP-binding protein [Campylobacter showae]|uniref:ABC transporter n=1 Tax=Campylobacter showae CC57C TaxID=1073353 RepID=M3JBI3_9BACT|nr:ABC transporter ATP-binding protein [Campylobacter showae]EMG30027.1 ABC transporter [Campylobacter showae CC57C]
MNAIEVKNLCKIYNQNKPNEFHALKNINLTVKSGDLVILKGVSGSGKSTLLGILGALSKPSSGEALINSRNVSKLPDIMSSNFRHSEVGFIFQSFNLIEGLSVYQNVLAPLSLTSLKKAELNSQIERALNLANIAHKKDQVISKLSGGEKQRCAIARALAMDPSIILADEPTANLDKQNSLIFIEMLKKFKELKKTVVVATHDILFDDLDFVDGYVRMQDGEML